MNLFNEVSRRLSEIASDLEINITEIYQVASTEFYQKHSLPAFHEWGDGFVQGDASDEEVAQAAKEWDGRDLTEPNEFGGVDFDQSAIDDFLLDLDQAFMELYVEKANEAFAASKKVTENEVEREEVEDGNYVVVYAVDAPDAEIAAQKYLDEKDDADRYTYETNTAWPVLGGEYGIDEVKWKVRYNCFEN